MLIDTVETIGHLNFDHVIHVVQDPASTRHLFECELGIHTIAGGMHPAWGTFNMLAYFGLPYIEWLGVHDVKTALNTEFGRNALNKLLIGEGAIQFAMRTRHMDELVKLWMQRQLPFVGPIEASRERPDGTTIRWRMLFPEQLSESVSARNQALLPFVIEWDKDDESRLIELREGGALLSQDVLRLDAVHLATLDATDWIHRFNIYFGNKLFEEDKELCFAQTTSPFQIKIGEISVFVWSLTRVAECFHDQEEVTASGLFQIDLSRIGHTSKKDDMNITPLVLAGLRVQIHHD
ncbi:hypothetical protein MM817_01291 [Acidibacillus sp. S0AB]|uniref:Glyoxalase-like domain-containing protein n=1 Tax=Sulfoacidibacillus ferrooxidans TaxID=2005001 RepID=A0A9X1V7K0_9BACL|nr:hypothetical protein [Sulfoacidibacillus ferrooxidans]